ncbi:hypothetical protein AVEN_180413-1 [Araneus ventricosus]|uniref:Uncharacterized protein n=1 Tax=Araneus ventricosus TaxID=182803 RepID=A0A4Y2JJ12_ARAVE|nr:hypothetical protein AVEN_180413-1 [Araneus ventricosus]
MNIWVRSYLPLKYFKLSDAEPERQFSSKSRSTSIGLVVTCILWILAHPALKTWVWAYLPLQFFNSANEEPVNQVSLKSPTMSTGQFVKCICESGPSCPESLSLGLFIPTVLQLS